MRRKNTTRRPHRISPAYRLTGIVSRGSTFLATGVDILDAQGLAEDHQQDGHEGHDQEAQGGTLRDERVLEERLDEVRDQQPRRATDHRWRQEFAEDRDEYEDRRRDEPGPDLG